MDKIKVLDKTVQNQGLSSKEDITKNRVQNLYLRSDGQVAPRSCKCFHPIKQQVRGQMPGSETHI